MKTNVKKQYKPLFEAASRLTADLNSGGFDASLEWHYSMDEGCPLPAITAAGYGTITQSWDEWTYRFILPRRKALKCHFPFLASEYTVSIYGHDFPENIICGEGDDINDAAFAISSSGEAFFNVSLTKAGVADILIYRKILADIERSIHDDN